MNVFHKNHAAWTTLFLMGALFLLTGNSLALAQPAKKTPDTKKADGKKPDAKKPEVRLNETKNAESLKKPGVFMLLNDQPMTAADVQLDFFLNQLPENATVADRKQLLNRVIDRELIKRYLKNLNIQVDEDILEQEFNSLIKLTAKQGESTDAVLEKMKLTREGLREILWVDAAWKIASESLISQNHLMVEWELRQHEYDGTRLRGSQIVFHVSPGAPTKTWEDAVFRMWKLREEISEQKITFADAARRDSQSPSGRNGGDLGEFEYRGRLDEALTRVAFRLEPTELSEPIRTRYGVHLLQVTDRIPGQLSLEDARPEMIARLSKRLWEETVLKEREITQIEFSKK
ncbi:MAG TPA: peptidylprolyl isomerase [Planctomicrobium sp.]|nr:peptidylprolyl isomerase [Planctomicrobium sp.]